MHMNYLAFLYRHRYSHVFCVGIGLKNVVGVKVDSRGKMNVTELDKEIQSSIDKGFDPFLVSATAGMHV